MVIARRLRRPAEPKADVDQRRVAQISKEFSRSGKRLARTRTRRLRANGIIALQAGLAAVLAWLAAAELLRTPEPVFAPVTAVGAIVASLGQRLRHSLERVAGVLIGIAAGDLLIAVVGIGPWQTGLAVVLAVYGSMLLSGSGQLVSQASSTAVLVGALTPQNPDFELPRFVNGVVGALVGLVVVVVLLPLNPLRLVERAGQPMLTDFAGQLREAARALAAGDADRVDRLLARNRDLTGKLGRLRTALQGAREATNLAPLWWHRREVLARYEAGAKHLERAVESSRPLLRRSVTLLRDREPVPRQLPTAVAELGEAVRQLLLTVTRGQGPDRARERALRAASAAGQAYEAGVGFSGGVVVAQVRTVGTDLLRATGLSRRDAVRLIRQAVRGRLPRTVRSEPEREDAG
ncbi:MAG TPA: FUSC family protein [Micromonosporaceae bacterium]